MAKIGQKTSQLRWLYLPNSLHFYYADHFRLPTALLGFQRDLH